jgi:hypothetical protein
MPNPMYQTPGASYTYASPPQLTTTGVDSSIPSVENCSKMGMDYDPVGKVCIPKAAAQTPQQGGGSDDDGGPDLPKPDPDAWMDDYDYTGDLSTLATQTGDALSSESFMPGLLGTFEKGVKMAHSAGHIILLQAQGKTTESEQLLKQWNKARTGALALTPTEMIDGDRFAIQAAGAHGIKLDRKMESPIDGKPIFRNDRDYERYLANYEVSVRERRKREATKRTAAKPEYIDTSKLKGVSTSTTFKKDGDTGTETAALRRQRSDDSKSSLDKMMADTRKRADDIKAESKKTGKSIAEIGRKKSPSSGSKTKKQKAKEEGDPRNMARGGLMKKK